MPTLAEEVASVMSEAMQAAPAFMSGGHKGGGFGPWAIHEKAIKAEKGMLFDEKAHQITSPQRRLWLAGNKANLPSPGFPAVPGNNPYYTGPGSLFGVLGAEPNIISTRVQPIGISGLLPAKPTNIEQPYFPYLTGFLGDSGSEPVGPCDDPISAGPGKSAFQTAQFGLVGRATRTIDIRHLGQRINRGEFWDLRLQNDPLLTTGQPSGSDMTTPQVNGNPQIFQEALMRFMEVGVSFQNKLSNMVWTGNPANNTATTDPGYAEFPGLDILIGTGKIDAFTTARVPALDSLIMDANWGRIDDNAVQTVQMFIYMARALKKKASRQNLDPATWLLVMREDLFYELSAIWPCAYVTSRCNVAPTAGGVTNQFVDAEREIAMRDSMRQGRYLLIDGEQWPVVFDDAIVENDGNSTGGHFPRGDFSSTIYFLPITIQGGIAATYFEYFDWSGQFAAMDQLAESGIGAPWFYTDGGRFLWHFQPPINNCIRWTATVKPRIILHTPQLAGKIQHVVYGTPLHTIEPFPTDPYFLNGGVSTNRTVPTVYTEWGTQAIV